MSHPEFIARVLQATVLLAIVASDLYFVSTGAVRKSLVVMQLMMIVTAMIIGYSRQARRRR